MNRSFPGSVRGSLAGRLARLFYDEVASKCSIGIDFHTGSNGRYNHPQIRCNMDEPGTRALAEKFCAPVLYHANVRDGSLRAAAAAAGVQALLYEGGEAHRFDEDAIAFGVEGAERVLHAAGVLPSAPPMPKEPPVRVSTSTWMRAGRSGFAHMRVEMGQMVIKGEILATVTDTTGGKDLNIRSRVPGIVIGALRSALVHRGDGLVHVALVGDEARTP